VIILNFTHPLAPRHVEDAARLCGVSPADVTVIDINAQIDAQAPLAAQVRAAADRVGWDSAEWQSQSLLLVPPALNWSATLLIAELHGRMGYFPPCLRMRPVPGAVPPAFEVAEVLDLQAQREAAREGRKVAGDG